MVTLVECVLHVCTVIEEAAIFARKISPQGHTDAQQVGGALDFTYRLARSSLPPRQQCVLFNNHAIFF